MLNPTVTQEAMPDYIQYSMIKQTHFEWFCKINLRGYRNIVDALDGVGYTLTAWFTMKVDSD